MSADPSALLLMLIDSRAPAGGHSHSGGVEQAVSVGLVRTTADVELFCQGRLLTVAPIVATAAAHAYRFAAGGAGQPWRELDRQLDARMPSPASRAASRALGGGLLRLTRAMLPGVSERLPGDELTVPGPHHPLVLGAACAAAGGSVQFAARAAVLAVCAGAASAAVRLLGLDPYAVQGILARLAPQMDSVAVTASTAQTIPAGSAPFLELLADLHARSEVRLFAS
jgi:urease accessory protein